MNADAARRNVYYARLQLKARKLLKIQDKINEKDRPKACDWVARIYVKIEEASKNREFELKYSFPNKGLYDSFSSYTRGYLEMDGFRVEITDGKCLYISWYPAEIN